MRVLLVVSRGRQHPPHMYQESDHHRFIIYIRYDAHRNRILQGKQPGGEDDEEAEDPSG